MFSLLLLTQKTKLCFLTILKTKLTTVKDVTHNKCMSNSLSLSLPQWWAACLLCLTYSSFSKKRIATLHLQHLSREGNSEQHGQQKFFLLLGWISRCTNWDTQPALHTPLMHHRTQQRKQKALSQTVIIFPLVPQYCSPCRNSTVHYKQDEITWQRSQELSSQPV